MITREMMKDYLKRRGIIVSDKRAEELSRHFERELNRLVKTAVEELMKELEYNAKQPNKRLWKRLFNKD